ncbi:MAG: hypothetical protein OXC02_04545 [Rhodobacteraceae bacterium]|nr:hypothetical protein [Paracoccaceae bacterium]
MKPNWENQTSFHVDNFPFLDVMNSETVDLIAAVPPFNNCKYYHGTPDSPAFGDRFQDLWS